MEMDSCPWSLGGILLGVKADRLEVENWETDDFFVGATIRNRLTNVRWDMITVYGPANHYLSQAFVESLSKRCDNANLPIYYIYKGVLKEATTFAERV